MQGLRADRLATLYLFHPLRRLVGSRGTGIPILMYHSISGADEGTRHPYYRTNTNPQVFSEHLKFLDDNRYKAMSLSEAVRLTEEATQSSERPVVFTFDDGFKDFYTHAFPILSKYGYTATVFLPTAYIGDTTRRLNGAECLTWREVRELRKAGINFGSHTVTHPQLQTLNAENVQDEVRCSKETIEDNLSCPVESFSYPYAFPETDRNFKQRLREALQAAKYENGVSTTIGTASRSSDRFFMERLPANSCDDFRLFKAKLDGAYDWLYAVQFASKFASLNR